MEITHLPSNCDFAYTPIQMDNGIDTEYCKHTDILKLTDILVEPKRVYYFRYTSRPSQSEIQKKMDIIENNRDLSENDGLFDWVPASMFQD